MGNCSSEEIDLVVLCLQANPDGSMNWPYYAVRAGKFYVGAMSGTQKDMH